MGGNSIYKSAGKLFSGTVIAQGIAFLAMPFLSRIYSPEEFGEAALFLSILGVLAVFAAGRYDLAIVVEEKENLAYSLFVAAVFIGFSWFLIFLGLAFWGRTLINDSLGIDPNSTLLYYIPFAFLLSTLSDISTQWHTRKQKFGLLASGNVSGAIVGASFKIWFGKLMHNGLNGLVIGQIFTYLVNVVIYLPYSALRWAIQKSSLLFVLRKYKSFPIYGTPAALVNVLGMALPIFIINYFWGEAFTGYFGNTLRLIYTPLGAASMAFGTVFFERISKLKTNKAERIALVTNTAKTLFSLALVPVLLVTFWGESIFVMILGEEWRLSGSYAQVTVWFFFIMYITSPFAAAFTVYDRMKAQFWFTLGFTLVTNGTLFTLLYLQYSLLDALLFYALFGILIRLLFMMYYFWLFEMDKKWPILVLLIGAIGFTIIGYAVTH